MGIGKLNLLGDRVLDRDSPGMMLFHVALKFFFIIFRAIVFAKPLKKIQKELSICKTYRVYLFASFVTAPAPISFLSVESQLFESVSSQLSISIWTSDRPMSYDTPISFSLSSEDFLYIRLIFSRKLLDIVPFLDTTAKTLHYQENANKIFAERRSGYFVQK